MTQTDELIATSLMQYMQSSGQTAQVSVGKRTTIPSFAGGISQLLCPANSKRKAMIIYNNSTNSLYICIEDPANAINLMDFAGSNAGPTSVVKWWGPTVYTGAIYCIRNAGTGAVTIWEFE